MKQLRLFGATAAIALAILLPSASRAQEGPHEGALITLRVEGLTSQDRDAVQSRLQERSDLKLVFACVPAGILVFQGDGHSSRPSVHQRCMTMLQDRAGNKRVIELEHGLAEAETACAEQRGQ